MELKEIGKNMLTSCLNVKAGEQVLIVTDDKKISIGTALYEAAQELGAEALMMTMTPRQVSGEEPPAAVAAAMKAADVVIAPMATSITHTRAKIEAAKAGARVATMPNITEDMFSQGAMTADYDVVMDLTLRVTELLSKASIARIEKDGCVLTMDLTGRPGIPSPGVYREKGQSGNLPSGEAYIAPLEDGSNGEMIIDGSMVGLGKLDAPLRIRVENGKLREITGPRSEELGILLANERSELRYLVPGRELTLQRRDWKYLSLFPMEGRLTGVCIRGAFYPLENAVLTADYPLGVSNEFIADTAQLQCSGGCGLVVLTRDDA